MANEQREKRELLKVIELLEQEGRLLVNLIVSSGIEVPDNMQYLIDKYRPADDKDIPF